ncbi:MAG: sensor histidine kinase [Gemmatimonadota bacterium]|nr:MAG: sensor histidine kinase [Gemmatimonadota bacterium]
MTVVIQLPETLDEHGFEGLVAGWAAAEGGHLLLDARHVRWVSPFGIVGLLAAGAGWQGRWGERPRIQMPENEEVISYLGRVGFFEAARAVFDLPERPRRRVGGDTDRLLEVTPIRSHQDVHDVIDNVADRAALILGNRLEYPAAAVTNFSLILSEVCQNVVEHAGDHGWVSAQVYNWRQRLGRKVVVIAVMDVGMGFRGSLAREHAQRYGDRWSDQTALEAAFLHGVSRYRDPGRGQGLQGIRKVVSRWNGLITIRSGTAQIAEVPDWVEMDLVRSGLPDFPGAQIQVVLPQRVAPDGGDGGRGDG